MDASFALLAGGVIGGVVVGIFSGMLGIGGGTLMIPLFRLVFGLSPLEATATSLFCVVPTSLSGAVQHVRNKTSLLKLGVVAGIGGALTSPLGVQLAQISPEWLVMLAAAVIIVWSAAKMFSKAVKMPKNPAAPEPAPTEDLSSLPSASGLAAGAVADAQPGETCSSAAPQAIAGTQAAADRPALTRKQLAQGALIGLGAGLASGYVGVGGGFLMVPLFLSVIGTSARQASGTSLVAVMILAVPGVIQQGMLGNIAYLVGIATCVGSIPGALVGARLAARVPERTLRFAFGYFLLLAAALLMVNELGILG